MTGKQIRPFLFNFGISIPIPNGNIDTLLKEGDNEASCFYTEFLELCKHKNPTHEQRERKKQITSILQGKIAAMKERKETEKRRREEIANEEMIGTQLNLFPIWVCSFSKQKACPRARF